MPFDKITAKSLSLSTISFIESASVNDITTFVRANSGAWSNNTGKSAYEVWLEIPANQGGTLDIFLNSLKGTPGADGVDGINGQSAYELWSNQPVNSGKTLTDFLSSLKGEKGVDGLDGLDGTNGQSVYDLWISQPSNSGKTLTDFLSSLKGEKGERGEIGYTGSSAYEIWQVNGGSGTEVDFLSSLKGQKGDTGETVANTDFLTEGTKNLFYSADKVIADSPVKTVAGREGDIVLGIEDIVNLTTTLNAKQPSGNYVPLVNNLIPSIYLPGSVDEIQEYTNYNTLTSTATGQPGVLYLTLNDNKVFRWSGSVYVEIIGSPGSTDSIVEGTNKFFTTQRASDAAPVQTVANKIGNVVLNVNDIQNLSSSLTATNTTTFPITAKLSTSLGAYKNDDIIPANTPFETILRNIFTTVIPATYPSPVFSVTPSVQSYEIGSFINLNIVPSYTKYSAGEAYQYRFKNGITLLSATSTATTFTSSVQLITNLTISCEVSYLSGAQRYDNTGTSSGTPPPSGTLTANSSYTFFRNNFYTSDTVAVSATTSAEIRNYESATTSRTFAINIATGDKRVSFAFPSNLTNQNVSIVQRGFGDITGSAKISTISVAGANNYSPINYTTYTYLLPSGYLQNQIYDVTI